MWMLTHSWTETNIDASTISQFLWHWLLRCKLIITSRAFSCSSLWYEMTTFSTARDENFIRMTTSPFQWCEFTYNEVEAPHVLMTLLYDLGDKVKIAVIVLMKVPQAPLCVQNLQRVAPLGIVPLQLWVDLLDKSAALTSTVWNTIIVPISWWCQIRAIIHISATLFEDFNTFEYISIIKSVKTHWNIVKC